MDQSRCSIGNPAVLFHCRLDQRDASTVLRAAAGQDSLGQCQADNPSAPVSVEPGERVHVLGTTLVFASSDRNKVEQWCNVSCAQGIGWLRKSHLQDLPLSDPPVNYPVAAHLPHVAGVPPTPSILPPSASTSSIEVIKRIDAACTRNGVPATKLFSSIDRDRDGALSFREVETMIRSFEPTCSDEEIGLLFKEMDRNGSGVVDVCEFCWFMDLASSRSKGSVEISCSRVNRHEIIDPSMWCVMSEQLQELLHVVETSYPESDPNAYTVVADVIKRLTAEADRSYALMKNPNGLKVRYFITHAWGESFKTFCRLTLASNLSGGLWVCFLANPQTWSSKRLDALLGANPYMSPFAVALQAAAMVVVVRTENVNMYERLWCVFELFLSIMKDKPIDVLGNMPSKVDIRKCGSRATCSNDKDTAKLREAISGYEETINEKVGGVMLREGRPAGFFDFGSLHA